MTTDSPLAEPTITSPNASGEGLASVVTWCRQTAAAGVFILETLKHLHIIETGDLCSPC